MQDLEYIDNYFKGTLPREENGRFEQRILSDPPFAEAVSFYCMAVQASKEHLVPQKKERFRILYRNYSHPVTAQRPALVRRLLPFAAAAAVLAALLIGWYVWMKPSSPQQLADNYIQQELSVLGVNMGNRQDSLQTGIQLHNEGKDSSALRQFESMIANNASDFTAIKYAGVVSLQLGDYDKALRFFRALQQFRLYSNPGKFYYALTLMKRSGPGDREQAKELLQQVVQNNLEGKQQAQQWLGKW